MERRNVGQWLLLLLIIVAVVLVMRVGLLTMSSAGQALPGHRVMTTRLMGIAYMVCDLTISSSLVILLITRDRRAPAWAEHRLPGRGRWVWHALLCLTILSYLSLAPTFLFFLIHMKK